MVDVVEQDRGDLPYGRIDVARDGDVDAQQRAFGTGRDGLLDEWGGDDVLARAGRADDDIRCRDGGGELGEGDSLSSDGARHLFGAGKRPIGYQDALDTDPIQALNGRLGGIPGADHEHRALGEIAEG